MIAIILRISLGMLAIAALLALFRIIRGPTLPDRVVALDLFGILVAGFTVVNATATGLSFFLDIALVIALLSFVGTIAYARYIELAERT